jgi:putative tricarboxylic transport membrane protein
VQTSAMGDGSLLIVLQRPIAATILTLAVLLAAGPLVLSRLRRRARRMIEV